MLASGSAQSALIVSNLAALQALLGSIAPEGSDDNSKLTPEQLKKLSKKLDEILGEDKGEGVVNQNEKGEVCLLLFTSKSTHHTRLRF